MGFCHKVADWKGHVGNGWSVGRHLLWSVPLLAMFKFNLFFFVSGLYCSGDWTRNGGWKYKMSKPATMPYEESYPKKNPKWERTQASDYYDNEFSKNKVPLQTSTTPFH